MSRLVSHRPAGRAPRSVIPRFTPRGDEHFLGRLDSLLERGHLVMVSRVGCGFLSIVKNGTRYLLRDDDDFPIGSYGTLTHAVAALDAHVEDGGTGDAA